MTMSEKSAKEQRKQEKEIPKPSLTIKIDVYPPNGRVELRDFPEDFNYMVLVLGTATQRIAQHFKARELENKIIKPDAKLIEAFRNTKVLN